MRGKYSICRGNEGRKVGRGGGFLLNESIFVLRGLLTRPKLNTLFKKPGFKFIYNTMLTIIPLKDPALDR